MTDKARRSLRAAANYVYRFASLTLAMCLGIVLLVVIEAAILWGLGVDYLPKMGIRSVGVSDFVIDDSGRWAVSRIVCLRNSGEEMLRSEVLLHDMQQPERPICLGVAGKPRQLAISPHAATIAIACYDGSIYVGSSIAGADPPRLVARLPRGEAYQLACSHDGSVLAAADGRFLYLWQLPGGDLLHRTAHHDGQVNQLSFAGNGQRLLTVGSHNHLHLWNVSDGKLCKTLQLSENVRRVLLSFDGATAALLTTGHSSIRMMLLNIETGDELVQESVISHWPNDAIALSSDRALIAAVNRAGENRYSIQIWSARNGQQQDEFAGSDGYVNGLAFAADGTLYSWDSKGLILGWDLGNRCQVWRFSALDWAKSSSLLQPSVSKQVMLSSPLHRATQCSPSGR